MKRVILFLAFGLAYMGAMAQDRNGIVNLPQKGLEIPSGYLHKVDNPATHANGNSNHHSAQRTTSGSVTYSDWFDYWNQNANYSGSTFSTLYSFLTYPDSNVIDNTGSTTYYIYCHGLGMSFDPTDKYYYYPNTLGSSSTYPGITDSAITPTQGYSVDSFRFPYEYVHNVSTSGTDSLIVELYVTTLTTATVFDSGTYTLQYNANASFLPITPDSTPRFATALYTKSASGLGRNECWDSITGQKQRYAFPLSTSGTTYTTMNLGLSTPLVVPAGEKVVSFIHFKSADSFALGTDATSANYIILFAGTTATTSTDFPEQPPHNTATGYPGSYQTGLIDENQTRYSAGATSFTYANHNILIPGVAFATPIVAVTEQAFKVTWIYTPPFPPITGAASVCAGSTITLSETATGGSWSSGTTSVATISAGGVVYGVSGGTTIITYTNSSGSATFTVTVVPVPTTPTISGSTSVCTGQTTTLSASETGGTWSSATTSIATVNASGVVTGVTVGTDIISYVVSNMCGTATGTYSISVHLSPTVAPITGRDTVCPERTVTLADATSGGTWSSATTSVATISATGVVTGVTMGTDVISYLVTSGGCSTASTLTVYVYCTVGVNNLPPPVAEKITVYPNPNNGAFSVLLSSPVDEQVIVKVTNITGRVVKELTMATNKTNAIQIPGPDGIYFISATMSQGKYVEKITILQ